MVANERRIARTPRSAGEKPRYRRDGKRLLFVDDGHVATMHVNGTGVRELEFGAAADWR